MRPRLALCIAIFGAIGSLYFAWSLHRLSGAVLTEDPQWPRPFPYPDHWLWNLDQWLDARYPTPPDHIKLHSELPRVRFTIGSALAICLLVLAAGIKTSGKLAALDKRCRPDGRETE